MHPSIEASDLRQGDICALPHVPIWNLKRANTMSGGMGEAVVLPTWDKVQQHGDRYLVAVCTQCCDLDNPRARTGVAIAPLMKVPAKPDDDRFRRIMESSRTDVLGRYEYVNLFPFLLPNEEATAVVADFSAIITMAPMLDAKDLLLTGREYSMDEAERTDFREKLAFMFGRDPSAVAEDLA